MDTNGGNHALRLPFWGRPQKVYEGLSLSLSPSLPLPPVETLIAPVAS